MQEARMMRAVITGGTGMVGQVLSARLAADGHEVIVLSRTPEKYGSRMPASVQLVNWDSETMGDWAVWVDGADAIINLAGARLAGPDPRMRWTDKRKKIICKSRRDVGGVLVEAIKAAANKPGMLLQASGIDYYSTGDQLVTEQSPPGDDFLSWVCQECWEASTAPVEDMGVRRVVMRTGPILNDQDGFLPPLILQTKLFAGGALGTGDQWLSWIHQDDMISAVRFFMEKDETQGAYNLAAPNPVQNAELAKTLGRVLNRPVFMRWPAFFFKIAFGQMAVTLLQGVRASSERLQSAGFEFEYPELEAALRDLLD
jgi:hypothetical protein